MQIMTIDKRRLIRGQKDGRLSNIVYNTFLLDNRFIGWSL
jgi:hypothetical protein